MSQATIGFAGVGMMGAGMAGRLLDAGHPVTCLVHHNRAPVTALKARGAREAADIPDLIGVCDVVITCLPNADVVEAFADLAEPSFRDGQVWIDTTTSRPETTVALAERLSGRGVHVADAPVTGGPPQAEAGTLASLVGCDPELLPRIEALVRPYSKLVRHFGPPGTGHAAKLLNNLVSQGTMQLLVDAYLGAGALGVEARALYDVMSAGAARSGTLEKAVAPALDGDYGGARFTVANAAKDLAYARDMLRGAIPDHAGLAALLADRLDGLLSQGRGDEFVSAALDLSRTR